MSNFDPALAQQGVEVSASDGARFHSALDAAVDYRGDVTLSLRSGEDIVGFIFSLNGDIVDLYPKDSPSKRRVLSSEITKIAFTGRDTAK